MSSKEFWTRKSITAKKTSKNTTSLTPGMLALPSMRCEMWMSCTVKTSDSTPQPMGRTADCQTPCAMP